MHVEGVHSATSILTMPKIPSRGWLEAFGDNRVKAVFGRVKCVDLTWLWENEDTSNT